MTWTSFLASVGVTFVGAFFAACWHILSRHGLPGCEDLAVGFDLLVATMISELGFLPGSHGLEVNLRWAGMGVLFVGLMAMAVITRFRGYEDHRVYEHAGHQLVVYPMKSKTAWATSIAGSVALCVFWWLNVNIGLVVSAWKGLR